MKSNIRYLSLLLFAIFYVNLSFAKFKTIEDAAISYDLYNIDVSIDKDGFYEEIVEFKITLLREQARSIAAKFPIGYNENSQKLEIIEAKTIINGEDYIVSDEMIEDKQIATNISGFDSHREVALSFPRPEVGATIYLKFKIKHHNIPIDKEFFADYSFGTGGYWKQANYTINSAIPLRMDVNDPYKKLSIKKEPIKDKSGYFRKAKITLKSPLINDVISEVKGSVLARDKQTYVSLTSLDSWKKLGNDLSVKYNEVLDQPLPESFLDIIDLSSKEVSSVNQINMVTKMLNEKIEYFGNWQSIRGQFIPQDFAKVALKQSGDCKDFAAITVKILRALGYKANVALVQRGAGQQSQSDILPTMSAYNHAMVKAIDQGGRVYWIDPTNHISMADGIFPDIAEKHSLILDENKSQYEQIDFISQDHAKILVTKIIARDQIIDVKAKLLGEDAMQLTASELYTSRDNLEDWIYNNMVSGNIIEKNRLSLNISPQLTSRIVSPITIELKYKNPNIFPKTNLGRAYSFGEDPLLNQLISVDVEKDLNDLYMGYPRSVIRHTIMKDKYSQKLENLNFVISTPFIELSRKCYVKDNDIIAEEKTIIKSSWIKNKEFKSKSFKKLQKVIRENLMSPLVVFQEKE